MGKKQWWRYNHESCSWLKGSPLIIPTHYQKVWSLVVQKGYNLTVFTSWQMKENKMFPNVDLFCAVTNQSKLCSSDDRTLINFLYQDRTHLFILRFVSNIVRIFRIWKLEVQNLRVVLPYSLSLLLHFSFTKGSQLLFVAENCAWRKHWDSLQWFSQLNERQGQFKFWPILVVLIFKMQRPCLQVNVIVTFNRSHETTTIHLFQKF